MIFIRLYIAVAIGSLIELGICNAAAELEPYLGHFAALAFAFIAVMSLRERAFASYCFLSLRVLLQRMRRHPAYRHPPAA